MDRLWPGFGSRASMTLGCLCPTPGKPLRLRQAARPPGNEHRTGDHTSDSGSRGACVREHGHEASETRLHVTALSQTPRVIQREKTALAELTSAGKTISHQHKQDTDTLQSPDINPDLTLQKSKSVIFSMTENPVI